MATKPDKSRRDLSVEQLNAIALLVQGKTDVGASNFTVYPPDPHRFDGDGDGVGCE